MTTISEQTLAVLRPLAQQFPTIDAAVAEIARLAAELALPKGTVHVISDVHGEDVKLRHVINNASGTLRPLVEQLFRDRLSPAELQEFITLLFYPKETLAALEPTLGDSAQKQAFCRRVLRQLFEMLRFLAGRFTLPRILRILPPDYRELFLDLLYEHAENKKTGYVEAIFNALLEHGRALAFIRLAVRVVRDLAIEELIIAGDFWDRGPRGDRVVDYVMRQPNVAITWGNHDTAWMGAGLGHEALIAHVLRISARYRRFTQLEEGYGINLQPLELLARTVYGSDPATCFFPKGTGLREPIQMARMQKACAIMQYKLEGQTIRRNPEYQLEHRRLLHGIDAKAGTIQIDGVSHKLRDTYFPTLDPANPYELSPEERSCLNRIRRSFLDSRKLWEHVQYLVQRGSMWLLRDDHLIFHGCVPVDAQGAFLAMEVDGKPYTGRALFDMLERVVARVPHKPSDRDLDLLWYLWCGPRSPLFGKDKIATLENDLVADKEAREEKKNPYFELIHEPAFCERVLAEFGADPRRGLIVNGHVPVKIDKGESPLKRSGLAITIDGAFSQAYGDHGYTLVLEPEQTFLAKHHHFESVDAAVREGVDILPTITVIRQWEQPRTTADTEKGEELRARIGLLEQLIDVYRRNKLRQGTR